MGKWFKKLFLKLGIKENNISEFCLNCGKKLEGSQRDFCSTKCGSYYHNVKNPIKRRRENEKNNA